MGTFTSKERRPEEGIVDKIIGEDCVVVFSTKTCSFCQKAKDSLSNMGIPFNAVELDEPGKESSKIVTDLTKITGERTVPQIFVNGQFIGGYTEMEQLKDAGRLIQLIHECATSRIH